MKWLTQIALPIAIVIAGIAGATFVSHYLGRPPDPVAPGPAQHAASAFALQPRPGTSWLPPTDGEPMDFELHRPGQHDFWFQQPHPQPVEVGLSAKGCGCSEVAIAVLTAAEAALPVEQVDLTPAGRWQQLKVAETPSLTLPAATAAPVIGVLRLSWQGRQLGPEALAFRLWTRHGNEPPASERFRHPVNFVPALQVFPTEAALPDVAAAGQAAAVEFWCWSRTRAAIPLQLKLQGGERGFACSSREATVAERAALPREIEASTVRGLQRVTVTLTDAAALDLGPFERRLVLTAEPAVEPAYAIVEGIVRGPVAVGAPRDRDRVDLGAFAARKGTQRLIPLEAEQAGLTLQVLAVTPAFLDVKLEALPAAAGRPRWQLAVAVPAGAAAGRLPPNSGVLLRLPDQRRLRIPVTGQATQ